MVPGIIGNHGELSALHHCLATRILLNHLSIDLDSLYAEVDIARTLDVTIGHAEMRTTRHEEVEDAEILVISTLGTINQRTTLNGNATAIVLHGRISLHGANGHVEMNGDNVALLPLTIDTEIAICALARES